MSKIGWSESEAECSDLLGFTLDVPQDPEDLGVQGLVDTRTLRQLDLFRMRDLFQLISARSEDVRCKIVFISPLNYVCVEGP